MIENFHVETARYRLFDRPSALSSNELLNLLFELRVLCYEDLLADPDWGIEFPFNRIVRLVAEKPRSPTQDCDWKGAKKPLGAEVSWGALRLRCVADGWERRK